MIEGRVAAVTGAARGIGFAVAKVLAGAGAKVALGDLDEKLARDAAERIGPGAIGLPLDVTSSESFERFVERVEAELGPLDVLVNNAGIMWVGPFGEEAEATALRQFDVNFHGTARGMRIVLPRMVARGRGHVVNIASAASRVCPPGEATYAGSKHAVLGYSDAVRGELRGTPVHVSIVLPAVVETDLAVGTSAGRGKRLTPEEVADAVRAVIERPRFEVHVPKVNGNLQRIGALLPARLRDRMLRALVPNMLESDLSARELYQSSAFGASDEAR